MARVQRLNPAIFHPTGVNPQLVWNVRRALDREGLQHVRIVVSGGPTVEKIRMFEEQGVPVDVYGVMSSRFQGRFDFTADVVRVDRKPSGKVGRTYRPQRVEWPLRRLGECILLRCDE